MTKAELFQEFDDVLEKMTITKTGAYNTLLKFIFDYFSTDDLKGLLEHIKKELE